MFCLTTILDRIANKSKSLIIFMRHAEKESIKLPNDNNLNITVTGRQATHALANYFQIKLGKNIQIKTSPVLRCVQTAEILASYQDEPTIEFSLTNLLGAPGPYISDEYKAAQTFKQYSVFDVVANQLNNVCLPGIRCVLSGTQLLIKAMTNDLNNSNKPTIYISHDVIMAAFVGCVIKNIQFDATIWPNYLNGICIGYKANQLCLYTANSNYPIDLRN